MPTDIVVTETEISDTNSDVSELASATFDAFHPYINIYDCGKKLWDEKTQKLVPMHMLTKEALGFANRYFNISKAQRKNYKPTFKKGKRCGKRFHFWGHYLNQILSSEKIAEGIKETEVYYYTSSLRRKAIAYLDVDAHDGETDELEAKRLMQIIDSGGFWNQSDRGQNGYMKISYGPASPRLPEMFFSDLTEEQTLRLQQRIKRGLNHSQINDLFDRAQTTYRRYLKHHGVACKFEVKGKITEQSPKLKSGSLAKLPLKGWSWKRLEEFKNLRETPWHIWERQLELLDQMLDEAENPEGITESKPEDVVQPPLIADDTEKPRQKGRLSDPENCAFTRNRLDCLPFIRSFYRQYGRTPSHQDFLDHLKISKLFTGAWDDTESDRDVRSARVLDYVLQTFDPKKLGKGEGRWHDLPVHDWIRLYAKQNYGPLTATIIKGKNEVRFTDDGLVKSGQRFQTCNVTAAFVHHCVLVILTCMEDLAENNGLPESRIVEVWSMLTDAPKWNRDHYAIVRNYLETCGVVDIYDKNHRARKCWRWKKGKNYPTSPEELKDKLDHIKSGCESIDFSKTISFSSSKITPYYKVVRDFAERRIDLFVQQRPPPFDDH